MIRRTRISNALVAAGLVALTIPAGAQEAGKVKTDDVDAVAGQATVVVTAQKRLQAASKVPVALSVISDSDIKSLGITNAANLTEQVPNVQIGTGAQGGMDITIRGIGNSDNTERGDPQTAYHVDGIYVGRPQGANALFFDIERVEVLRGPQGTLYGRNANAGAINVITRKPSKVREGEVAVELGNYASKKIDGMVNIPVNDELALRAVVSSQKHDGYSDTAKASNSFSKDQDDLDNVSARVSAKWNPSPNVQWLLGASSSRIKGAGPSLFDITGGKIPDVRSRNPQVEGSLDDKASSLSSELSFNLGMADLVYLYGWQDAKRKELTSSGNAPSTYNQFSNEFAQGSHELRLASNGNGPLQWVAGLYRFKEIGHHIDLDVHTPAGGRAIHFVQDPAISESKAVFGQATYSLLADWRATAGVRFNRDEKSRKGQTRTGPADTPIGAVGNLASGNWNKFTYRLGLEHDLSATSMAYLTLSTGYKAGGYNDGNGVVGDPNYNAALYYKPESIKSYEIGYKGRIGALQVGVSAFQYDYSDLQKSAVINNSLNTINTGMATVRGLEAEGRLRVSKDGRINFAVGLLDSAYDVYKTPNGQDFSGQSLDRSPKSTATIGYTHDIDLEAGGRVTLYAGTRYTAAYQLSDTGTATQAARIFVQPSTTKSNLTLTYVSADDLWQVQAFVKNIEDKASLTSMFALNGKNYGALSEPRTFGARASRRF